VLDVNAVDEEEKRTVVASSVDNAFGVVVDVVAGIVVDIVEMDEFICSDV